MMSFYRLIFIIPFWYSVSERCCDAVVVTSSGIAASGKNIALGVYVSHSYSNGKMTYKNSQDKYMAHINNQWLVSYI